jgi:hypothetical protein
VADGGGSRRVLFVKQRLQTGQSMAKKLVKRIDLYTNLTPLNTLLKLKPRGNSLYYQAVLAVVGWFL